MIKPIIIMTAKDYDLPVSIVKDVYENNFDNFYEELERVIKERRNG